MGKPLSRPGCFRKSSCCLEKHGVGDGGVGGRDGGMEGGYGDGYVPQRSIYETMCINQQIDSQHPHPHHHHHHHHPGGSVRRDVRGEGSFYSASGSLRVSRSPADMFDAQPRSLTPNPSFVRRLDERAIYDSLKLGAEDGDGGGCHSPGHFNRSVSPAVSSFSAPGVSSSSSKKHHHHHHHGDSTKSRDGRQSWKVLTPPKHLECMELSTNEVMDRGGGYLVPQGGHYAHPGGQSSSLTSPLISPFSGSPLSSGYHTPVFFSPAKPRSSQSQSLRCSPPQVIQPRHYSQTQSLRLSPPHELRRSPYRVPLVQLSAHDLEQDLKDRGGWGRSERERGWERERERELERGWAQREWERERERGRLERERARERERKETSFATFGYGHTVPLCSDRDSVFLEPEQVRDTTPLLLPQPSPSPSPNAAPRMGTGAVGRNRAGSKVGSESVGGGMVSKFDDGSVGLVLVDSKTGCGPRLVSDARGGNTSEAEMRAGMQEKMMAESCNKYDSGARPSMKNGPETRMGSQLKTRSGGGWDLEGQVQTGVQKEHVTPAVNKEGHTGGASRKGKSGRNVTKQEPTGEAKTPMLIEKKVPREGVNSGHGAGLGMKFEKEPESKSASRPVENRTETVPDGSAKVTNEFETEEKIIPTCEPEAAPEVGPGRESGAKTKTEDMVVSKAQNISKTTDEAQLSVGTGDKLETVPDDPAQKTPECSPSEKRYKSKSSKSSSRTRPGTATGLRPGVFSPRLSKGLADLDSTGPAEGIESTWPRRLIVRKRTVRQGGALHNLPILPPLPSVLSALEKRRPLALHHLTKGHFSENPLSNVMEPTSLVGRCSLRESSHQEPVQGANLVGRASLKEQNLEHWRVYRDQEEPRRSGSREKHGDQSTERTERNERRGKEQKNEKECTEQKYKREGKVGDEKEKVSAGEGREEETKPDGQKSKVQENGNKVKELKKDGEIKCEKTEDKDLKMKDGGREHGEQELVAQSKTEVEVEEGDTFGDEQGMESWDSVLEMVNTLWDDGWEKGEARGGDTDSLSGSLPRWPLLRPPLGFGGSHPPSSAASELSLTELERRARELDSDLEHLDLSQPHRDQTSAELQRERADIDTYQTHPGPQREKAALLAGMGSRSQVSLELSGMVSPATDTDSPAGGWSTRPSAGTPTVGSSSNKEDSSPDSNLTLESDSSGVFLSISNQSQEETGSDSDQPISGSDLGSSNTSLEKDGDDGGLKEWGREESAELQWCYPSLLNTSTQEDVEGDRQILEDTCGHVGADELEDRSIVTSPQDPTDPNVNAPQSEGRPQRKNMSRMETDPPLPLAPSVQPIKRLLDAPQKPIRSSGLDCGDLDPFVQSDSFVYLAVSARPGSHGEVSAVSQVPGHNAKQDGLRQHLGSRRTHLEPSNLDQDSKPTLLGPHKPEEGDFLCTDSFVYLAAPACLLLGPEGTTPYSGRDSDSESSGSGAVDVSVLGCGSVAGDSDWDSDLSDSDPSRSSRTSAGTKPANAVRVKRPLPEQGWDKYEETADPDVLNEFLADQDRSDAGVSRNVTAFGGTASPPVSMATQPIAATTVEQASTTKKVTWQFKPAQRSVCTGSRKEKEVTSSSARSAVLGRGEGRGPSPSSSSSSSPSSSSSD